MAINDEVATNPTLKPYSYGCTTDRQYIDHYKRNRSKLILKQEKYTGQKVLVVVKSPFDILYLIDQG